MAQRIVVVPRALTRDHVELAGDGALVFDYPAKSGKRRLQAVVDPDVYDVVAALKRRRGERLFRIRSPEINAYIKEVTGGDFSAKNFRTRSRRLMCTRRNMLYLRWTRSRPSPT